MNSRLKLVAPIRIAPEDIQHAWFEQARQVPAVSRAYNELIGVSARAADRLNQALDLDVPEWFTRGWAAVAAVHDAIERSLLAAGPPQIITLDRHTLSSTSYLALSTEVPHAVLPELELALQLSARVPNATLAIKQGGIELLALGDVIVTARLRYGEVLLNQHVTSLEGAPRDPFKRHPMPHAKHSRADRFDAAA